MRGCPRTRIFSTNSVTVFSGCLPNPIRGHFRLRYLTENKGLQRLQSVADRIVNDHRHLLEAYPYENFANGAVPGEDALVRRQIYEVLKRQRAAEVLDQENS